VDCGLARFQSHNVPSVPGFRTCEFHHISLPERALSIEYCPTARAGLVECSMKASLRFRDRPESGRRLPAALERYADRPNLLVLALPEVASRSAIRWAVHSMLPSAARGIRAQGPEHPTSPFFAVGTRYEDFAQVNDDEVYQLLERATLTRAGSWC